MQDNYNEYALALEILRAQSQLMIRFRTHVVAATQIVRQTTKKWIWSNTVNPSSF